MTESLGVFLKNARLAAGLTQEQIAEIVDVNPVYISHIETGHRSPSWKLLLAYAQALKLNVTELLRRAGLISTDMMSLEGRISALVAEEPRLEVLFEAAREMLKNNPRGLEELINFAQWVMEKQARGEDPLEELLENERGR